MTELSYIRTQKTLRLPIAFRRKSHQQRHLGITDQLGTGVAQATRTTLSDPTLLTTPSWRTALPVLTGRTVILREPEMSDLGPLVDLLSLSDATRFGLDESLTIDMAVQQFIGRVIHDRTAGLYGRWRHGELGHVGVERARVLAEREGAHETT